MISIIIPVVRPERAKRCIDAIRSDIQHEIIAIEDTEHIGCPKMVKKLVGLARYDWIMFLGDDTIPQPGFIEAAVTAADKLPNCWGMVGINDQIHNGNNLSTHWMCHKNMLGLTDGELFHTGYSHCYCDMELLDIAKEHGRFVWAEESRIVHDHPAVTGEKSDEHYQRAYSTREKDKFLYLRRKEARIGAKVAIGLPSFTDNVSTLFFLSFIGLEKPAGTTVVFPTVPSGTSDIAKIREGLCVDAIDKGCTHLLMMDTDQVYHDEDLISRMLSHRKDIVGGKVHRRYPPFEPILNVNHEHVPDDEIDKGGLIRVDATGTGCLLIRLSCLEHIERPWFEMSVNADGGPVGEDIGFCYKAAKAGKDIFVDCGVNIGHLAVMQVDGAFYKVWNKINKVKK